MKTYNERLPLIDAAIEQTRGVIPEYRNENGAIYSDKGFVYRLLDSSSVSVFRICTIDEFNQRKAELASKDAHGQDTLEKRPEPKEQEDMNDWYDKGEFPPVGAEVESPVMRGVVVALPDDGDEVVCVKTQDGRLGLYTYKGLRPIPTETDKLVDEAELDIRSLSPELDRQVIRKMIDAGYRKIKPMSEDEFMKSALKSFGSKNFEVSQLKLVCESLRKLHKAGCRFISGG